MKSYCKVRFVGQNPRLVTGEVGEVQYVKGSGNPWNYRFFPERGGVVVPVDSSEFEYLEEPPEITLVHRISIGEVPAKPARLLKVGEKVVFNYGFTYTILTVSTKGNWIEVQLRPDKADGLGGARDYCRKFKPETLVPFQRPQGPLALRPEVTASGYTGTPKGE